MAKIYTKSGDSGQTSLYSGERVSKCCDRVECYGTIDELQATLGLARSFVVDKELNELILGIQKDLMRLMSDLASVDCKAQIAKEDVEKLEAIIDRYTSYLPQAFSWQVPGGCHASAALHVARTVARRCERCLIRCIKTEDVCVTEDLRAYMNRLSDVCYTLARYIDEGEAEN